MSDPEGDPYWLIWHEKVIRDAPLRKFAAALVAAGLVAHQARRGRRLDCFGKMPIEIQDGLSKLVERNWLSRSKKKDGTIVYALREPYLN